MDLHSHKFFLTTLLGCSISFATFSHEAPVVDAQQDTASTQIESTGAEWQSMPNAKKNDSDNPQNVQNDAQLSVQNETTNTTQTNNTQNNTQTDLAPAPVGSIDQRVSRLEQQISNLTRMNLPQQVNDLHQTVSQLQGQLQVQDRDTKTLTTQQTNFYQDLQQQIAQLKKSNNLPSSESAAMTKNTISANNQSATSDDAGTYGKAFQLVSARHFKQAKTGFENYLEKFPKGRFVANARFWLGEIAMSSKDYDEATTQFQDIISQYPTSSKVPDAKLKLATIHAATGKTDVARAEFTQITKSYSGSTAAQLASIQLQQLTK